VLPKHVSRDLLLPNLESTEGLILPEYVGGYLNINDLKDANGLILPSYVGGGLQLFHVISAEKLIFPEYVGGYLDLSNLRSTTGLEFPEHVGGPIWLLQRVNTELLFLPKTFKANIVYGNLFANIGGKIYSYCTTNRQKKRVSVPVLRSKKKIGAWLERVKNVDIPKWLLVWFLTRQFSEEQANDLADTIFAAKMLTG
jgi:hypothetical protein